VWLRIIRWAIALSLIPPTAGAAWALWDLIQSSSSAVNFWICLGGGSIAWLILFYFLPKPLWIYVVGHELTHAIWALLFGARITGFRATTRGGHVVISKTNPLIALAPYFFPFYTVVWLVLCAAFGLWQPVPRPILDFGIGLTYAFHCTLTVHILKIEQPDIVGEGYFFSGVVIAFANLWIALFSLAVLTGSMAPRDVCSRWCDRTGQVLEMAFHFWLP
jgi:hypothetical protein